LEYERPEARHQQLLTLSAASATTLTLIHTYSTNCTVVVAAVVATVIAAVSAELAAEQQPISSAFYSAVIVARLTAKQQPISTAVSSSLYLAVVAAVVAAIVAAIVAAVIAAERIVAQVGKSKREKSRRSLAARLELLDIAEDRLFRPKSRNPVSDFTKT
jgi:hypothetical protein